MMSSPPFLTTLLLTTLLGSEAYTFPTIFGPPRTRASALLYAKKAVFKLGELEHTPDSNAHNGDGGALDDVKNALHTKVAPRSKVDMVLSPDHVPGSVDASGWLLPVAALVCYTIPIMILYFSGGMGTDRFQRAKNGVTLEQRAVNDFLGWLVRIGLMKTPSQTPAGCARPSAARALSSPRPQ